MGSYSREDLFNMRTMTRTHRPVRPSTRRRISPEEMRRLCDAPPLTALKHWRDRALLHTLASSGLRASELVTLQEEQVIFRAGSYFLEIPRGKYQPYPREACLSHEARAALEAWIARRPLQSSYLFTAFQGRSLRPLPVPLSTRGLRFIVEAYARCAGLAHVSPHGFRRFLGTQLARSDIRMAQKALGHASIATTAKHYVLDDLTGGLSDGLY